MFKQTKVKKSLFNSFFLQFLTNFDKHISNREKYDILEYVQYVIIIPRVLI